MFYYSENCWQDLLSAVGCSCFTAGFPEHLPGCDLFVLNLIVGKRNLVHIKPLSPSGPTNRISFPSLVSNNLHGATGSSGSLCWYHTPRTSWMASAPTSSTCTTSNLSTTRWVNSAPCNQQKTGAVLWAHLMFHDLFPGKLRSVRKDSLGIRRKSNEAIPLGARSDCPYEGTCLAAWAPSYPCSGHPCPSSTLSLWLLANSFVAELHCTIWSW